MQIKTKERVWIPTSRYLQPVLDPWLRDHPGDWFFCNAEGRHLTLGRIRTILYDAIHDAGLPPDCKPHGLRVTFATRLIELGVNYRMIESIVGHRTMTMAIKYTEKKRLSTLAIETLDRGLAAYHAGLDSFSLAAD
jgi:site-specific recombinase XerD